MVIGANSYGSVAEVEALCRHLTNAGVFDASTIPTATQVEKFIDRRSGILNTALASEGFTIPVAQSDAKLACADFVVRGAVADCELTRRSAGATLGMRRRETVFQQMWKEALDFVKANREGFIKLGVVVSRELGRGLFAGGISDADKETEEDDTDRVTPSFKRGLFTYPGNYPRTTEDLEGE